MLTTLWATVASVWSECYQLPQMDEPDTIVDVFGPNSWKICKEILFLGFLKSLPSLDTINSHKALETIEFRNLVRLQKVEDHACATVVHLSGSPEVKFVFKGVDFRTFLSGYELGCFGRQVDLFTHSIALLSQVPGHPNIIPLPRAQVVFTDRTSNDKSICGVLYPFYEKGSLAEEIKRSNEKAERIPVALKRKWCFQMAQALAHTHFVAGTFHMDISPANFVIDDNDNLLLTNWEQGDAAVITAAPEIDGTWDAANGPTPDDPPVYTEYHGPPRRNMPVATLGSNGWNTWNSFLAWQSSCPKASELAEVFSLGRTMWMLLHQRDISDFVSIESTEEVVEEWEQCQDIPAHWRKMVEKCLQRDPGKRSSLMDIVHFWDSEMNC